MEVSQYGESKDHLRDLVSDGTAASRALMTSTNRTLTIWIRPLTHRRRAFYAKVNPALQVPRNKIICETVQPAFPRAIQCDRVTPDNSNIFRPDEHCVCDRKDVFHRLFSTTSKASIRSESSGIGLDSHSTWEALIAGCIPIVPTIGTVVDVWADVTPGCGRGNGSRDLRSQ